MKHKAHSGTNEGDRIIAPALPCKCHKFSWQGLKDDYRTWCGLIGFSEEAEQ